MIARADSARHFLLACAASAYRIDGATTELKPSGQWNAVFLAGRAAPA